MQRRSLLGTTATLGVGALAGCAMPCNAAKDVRTPFEVLTTYIPVVGSDQMFPVRHIYCIGRNYAAHAREMGTLTIPSVSETEVFEMTRKTYDGPLMIGEDLMAFRLDAVAVTPLPTRSP